MFGTLTVISCFAISALNVSLALISKFPWAVVNWGIAVFCFGLGIANAIRDGRK